MDRTYVEPLDYSDFFIGAVPPYLLFRLGFDDLRVLVGASSENQELSNSTAEVCLIGLAAHFEAFCKNQFAGIINVWPYTLERFCNVRGPVAVEASDILTIINDVDYKLGSLLAERYDFGSARLINGLFTDLLNVTPFSKDEEIEYSRFLNDRNLLVHHGGIYTFKYQGQKFVRQQARARAHLDSLIVNKGQFLASSEFVDSIARKITAATHKALGAIMEQNKDRLRPELEHALEAFLWDMPPELG